LASRIEAGDAGECVRHWLHAFRATPDRSLQLRDHCGGAARAHDLPDSYLPALLETLSRGDESRALEALVACAPALREMAEALAQRRDAYALLPPALPELPVVGLQPEAAPVRRSRRMQPELQAELGGACHQRGPRRQRTTLVRCPRADPRCKWTRSKVLVGFGRRHALDAAFDANH